MPRSLTVLLVLLVGMPFAFSASAAGGDEPAIEMRIATTKTKLKAFGHVNVEGPGKIWLRFDQYEGDSGAVTGKWLKVASDGTFSGSYDRPPNGTCVLIAKYKATGGRVSDTDELPCARPNWGTGDATIQTGAGPRTIEVEIADDNAERQYGLMYRKHLGATKGMAFQFPSNSEGGFWMGNCLIPLSIAFYDTTNHIVSILDMQPCSEANSENSPEKCEIYEPGATYRGALEVNLGAFDEWGVEVGDTILVTQAP